MKTQKPLSIFLLNCDWRDMFAASHKEFRDKLARDRLGRDVNSFFVFSWARRSYQEKRGNVESVHRSTRLDAFRPLLDLWTTMYVPFYILHTNRRYDIWLCYDFGFLPALWLAKMLRGGRLVMCLNNQPRIYSRTRSFGSIKALYSWCTEKLFSRLVDAFFTINDTMRSYIKNLGVHESRIFVFAMDTIGRDKEFIDKAQEGSVRKLYGIAPHQKILLTVARLEAEKNYPKLLELCAGLGEDYVLVALGRGSLLPQLQEQARQLGMEKRVFFPGFIHRDTIWNYYKDADVFVLLSKAEALGVVFWEAMYMNVPVVGSDVPGIVESIGQDGERGRIWQESSGQEGFNKIIRSLSSSGDMVVRARTYALERISNGLTINDIV